jgi:DNA-binding transcriptional LysR family regulator
MDRLEAMAILVAASEAGSLSAASQRLDAPLATISRKLSELEKHLGARLLSRSSRHLALTEAGRSYVAACRRILDEVGEAERAAAGEYSAPRGNLLITAPLLFGRLHVLPVLLQFLDAYPEIDAQLLLTDRVRNVTEDHIDLAVRLHELPDSSLVATRVGSVRQVVCGSPVYLAACGMPNTPEELAAACACISVEGQMSRDAWVFRRDEVDLSVPIHSRLTVNTAQAAIDAAIAGLGVARVLSYQIEDARRAGLLAIVLAALEPPPRPVNLVHAGTRPMPVKLRAFLDFAAPRLKANLSRLASSDGAGDGGTVERREPAQTRSRSGSLAQSGILREADGPTL